MLTFWKGTAEKRTRVIGWYEEVRDSGTDFFFEWLPAGETAFNYRVRANMAGEFKVGPATLRSRYAPGLTASSAGRRPVVVGEEPLPRPHPNPRSMPRLRKTTSK